MQTRYVAAAIQMNSGPDKYTNLEHAVGYIHQAAAAGAKLIVLPEMFNCMGPYSHLVAEAEPIPGTTSQALSKVAAEESIYLLAGSIIERSEDGGVFYNTSMLFSPAGEMIARYRKIHLFDIQLPGQRETDESRWIKAGNDIAVVDTTCGRMGLSICYDLRFPELYRQLVGRGAEIFLAPAAFRKTTGQDHWEVLLRARAIENQAYIIAANQCGTHAPKIVTYGHSMIIDAWGNILTRADSKKSVIFAEIDLNALHKVRGQLPAFKHRRDFSPANRKN